MDPWEESKDFRVDWPSGWNPDSATGFVALYRELSEASFSIIWEIQNHMIPMRIIFGNVLKAFGMDQKTLVFFIFSALLSLC